MRYRYIFAKIYVEMDQTTVIDYLRAQAQQLEDQLEALNRTIGLLQTLNSRNALPNMPLPAVQVPTPEVEKAPRNTAEKPVKAPKVVKNELRPAVSKVGGHKVRAVKMPTSYKPELSYTKKIVFLLKENGPLTSQELIEAIQKREPKTPLKKIDQSVKISASALYRKKLVNAERKGRAYVYSV